MKHFTLYHGYIVDCAPDLTVGPSARIHAAIDKADEAGTGALTLCAQANLAAEAIAALAGLRDAVGPGQRHAAMDRADALIVEARDL